jgi:hypothetical protein
VTLTKGTHSNAANAGGKVVVAGANSSSGLAAQSPRTPQEDAMEFMTYLLESLNEEMTGADKDYEDQGEWWVGGWMDVSFSWAVVCVLHVGL